jgi:hypothetical protein
VKRELLIADAKNNFFFLTWWIFSCNFKKHDLLSNRCRDNPTLVRGVIFIFLGPLEQDVMQNYRYISFDKLQVFLNLTHGRLCYLQCGFEITFMRVP